MTFFKVATLDNWSWLMRDIMAGQRAMDQPPFAWVMFVIYLVITAFLFLKIFTAIVMDQYDFTARVTSKPRSNGVERQIMTFNHASTISEEWSYLDPKQTDFIDETKVRGLLQGEPDSKNKPVLSTQSARSALKNKNRAYWGAQNRRIRTASTIHSK